LRRGRVTKAEARVPRAIRTMIAHVHADRLHYALVGTPNRYSLPQTQEEFFFTLPLRTLDLVRHRWSGAA